MIHPFLTLLVVVFAAGLPWWVRLIRLAHPSPRFLEITVPLGLASLVLVAYWPLVLGEPPTSHDHGFLVMKLIEAAQALHRGQVFGWTDLEYGGIPNDANYPPGGALLGAFLWALPRVDLQTAYAWSILTQELVLVLAMYLVGRIHWGRWVGIAAGLLALCDRGDWWTGGYFSSVEVGMWIQALSTSLLLIGLALWPLGARPTNLGYALLSGAFIGVATVVHPQATMLAALAGPAMVAALISVPGNRVRDVAVSSTVVAVAAWCTSAWWFALYVAKHGFSNPPPIGPPTSLDVWSRFVDGTLLRTAPLWWGVGLVGLVLLARRRDAFSRFVVVAVPLIAVFTCADALRTLRPSKPDFADTLQFTRVYFLVRPLVFLAVAYAVVTAVGSTVRAQGVPGTTAWRGLPMRLLFGMALGLAVSLPGALIPGWPGDPTPQGVPLGDRGFLDQALDRAAQLLQPGERLVIRHHDPAEHNLVFGAAERQLKMAVIGWDAAVMYKNRFSSDNLNLLRRVGSTVLLTEGEMPEEMRKLPLVAQFGPYGVRTIPRLARAWMIGAGVVDVVSWSEDEIHLRVRGAQATSKIGLGMAYYDAWFTDDHQPTEALPFEGATLSQVPAKDGDVVIRYHAPLSQRVGLAMTVLGWLGFGWALRRRRRLAAATAAVAVPAPVDVQVAPTPRWAKGILALVALGLLVAAVTSPKDLAKRATWSTSSAFEPDHWPKSGRTRDRGIYHLMFHTAEEDNPWAIIDLRAESTIHSLSVTNREDCCRERAVPLVVESSLDQVNWQPVARKEEVFDHWSVSFTPRIARYVRFKVPRHTALHLRDVSIY